MIDNQIQYHKRQQQQQQSHIRENTDDDVIPIDYDEHNRIVMQQQLQQQQPQNQLHKNNQVTNKANNLQLLINNLIQEDYKESINKVVNMNGNTNKQKTNEIIEINNNNNSNCNNRMSTDVIIEDIDLCPLCKKAYLYKKPKMLTCLHTFCECCLPKLLMKINNIKSVYVCNVCKQETDIECVIDNLFLFNTNITQNEPEQESLSSQQLLVKCTNCDENNYSEWYCTNCNELLCEDCRIAHSRVKLTKDHVIISNNQQIQQNKTNNTNLNVKSIINYLNCHIHTREKLNIFCETCDILTCRDCQLSQMHKEHKYKYLNEAANIQRNKFNLYLKQLKQRKLLIEEAKQLYYERNIEIGQQYEQITNQIKQITTNYIIEINKRTTQLIQYLESLCYDKRMHIKRKTIQINDYFKKFNYSCRVVENAIKSQNEAAILLSKRIITNQLNNLMQEKIEVLNPQYRFSIQFINELKKDFKLGHLIIDGQQIHFPQDMPHDTLPTTTVPSQPLKQATSSNSTLKNQQQNNQHQIHHTTPPMPVDHSNGINPLGNTVGVQIAPQYQSHLRVQTYNSPSHSASAAAAHHQHQQQQQQQHNMTMPPSSSSTPSSSKTNMSNMRSQSNTSQTTNQIYSTQQQVPPPPPPSLNMRTLHNYNIVNQKQQSMKYSTPLQQPAISTSNQSHMHHHHQHQQAQQQQHHHQQQQQQNIQNMQQHQQHQMHNPNRPTPILPKPNILNGSGSGSITNGTVAIKPSNNIAAPTYSQHQQRNQQQQQHQPPKLLQPNPVLVSPLLQNQQHEHSAFSSRKSAFMPHPSTMIPHNQAAHTPPLIAQSQLPPQSPTTTPVANTKTDHDENRSRCSSTSSSISQKCPKYLKDATPPPPQAPSSPHLLNNSIQWTENLTKQVNSLIKPNDMFLNSVLNTESPSPPPLQQAVRPKSTASTPPDIMNMDKDVNQSNSGDEHVPVMPKLLKYPIIHNNGYFRSRSCSSRTSYSSTNEPVANVNDNDIENNENEEDNLDIDGMLETREEETPVERDEPVFNEQNELSENMTQTETVKEDEQNVSLSEEREEEQMSRPEIEDEESMVENATIDEINPTETENDEVNSPLDTQAADSNDETSPQQKQSVEQTKTTEAETNDEEAAKQKEIVDYKDDEDYGDKDERLALAAKLEQHLDFTTKVASSDLCTICNNDGELLICDYCPRVYHLQCHVPTIHNKPEAKWRCGLCDDLDNILKGKDDQQDYYTISSSSTSFIVTKRKAAPLGLNKWELKICERILLLLYSQPGSQPFHQPVNRTVQNYYKLVKHPMDFKTIKHKLYRGHFDHYNSIDEFISDVRLVFSNCALYNQADSDVEIVGRDLNKKFEYFISTHLSEFILNTDQKKQIQLNMSSDESSTTSSDHSYTSSETAKIKRKKLNSQSVNDEQAT